MLHLHTASLVALRQRDLIAEAAQDRLARRLPARRSARREQLSSAAGRLASQLNDSVRKIELRTDSGLISG